MADDEVTLNIADGIGTLKVAIEYLDQETGLWCNTCMLSNAARIWFTLTPALTAAGPEVYTSTFCVEADEDEHQVEP